MIKGDRVLFVALWSTFYKQRGEVTSTTPHLMVRLDGDEHPMRVRDDEVIAEDDREVSMTGAE